ncbi:hypothetical protein BDW62DRAFT_206116 [Aspergillus aurantiobrunneus]
MLPPTFFVHASIITRTFAIGVRLGGFPLLSMFPLVFEGYFSSCGTVIRDASPFSKFCYHTLWFIWIAVVLFGISPGEGSECRCLDNVLTNYGFQSLAKLIRKIDYWYTPKLEKDIMLEFMGLWETVSEAIQAVNTLDEFEDSTGTGTGPLLDRFYQEINDRFRKALDGAPKPHDRYSKVHVCHRRTMIYYRRAMKRYSQTITCYRKAIECCRKTLRSNDSFFNCLDTIQVCYDMTLGCYKSVLDCYDKALDNRYRNALYLQLRVLIQCTEQTRDEFSKLSVWNRAWVRPFLPDIDRGLKLLLAVTTIQNRCGTSGKEHGNNDGQG